VKLVHLVGFIIRK